MIQDINIVSTENASKKSKFEKVVAKDSEYREFVSAKIQQMKGSESFIKWLKFNEEALLSVYLLDFDSVREKLISLYSEKNSGRRLCDPQVILRSLLLMFALKENCGITRWAQKVKTDAKLALFCGTTTKKAPSVGTYYELNKRLENGAFMKSCEHRILPSKQRQARDKLRLRLNKPLEKEEYKEEQHGEKIRNHAKEVISREEMPIKNTLEKYLNEILLEVGVKGSKERGFLKSFEDITVLGDGSTLRSFSNNDGKRLCDCRKKRIFNCDHPRKYSDLDAQFGWDNRKKDFVYGYRYFQLVVSENKHDLPVYVNINSANTHEAKMAINAIDNVTKMGIKIRYAAFDALYDSYGFYEYLQHKKILSAIPYAKTPAKTNSIRGTDIIFDENGVPICPGGIPMRRHAKDKQDRVMYTCPVKRFSRQTKSYHVYEKECPLVQLCEPESKLGPILHVGSDVDLRLHPLLPRGSKKYKELLKLRSSCERSNANKKHHYKLAYARTRVMSYAHIHLVFISILEHSTVWAKSVLQDNDILSLLTQKN